MNNIADVIPSLVFASAGLGLVLALGLTTYEQLVERLSARQDYQPMRQAPLPRPTLLVQHQDQVGAVANDIKAAA